MSRWLELDGAVNVRDLGGLPTQDGRATRPGVVLRSDNLQALSERDVQQLRELGVGTVVDLRTPVEVTQEGPGPLVDVVRHVNLDLIPSWGAERAVPHEKREQGDLSHFYLTYLDDAPDAVVQALREIVAAKGATVVHCAAGKDRTGVVCALALVVAGVLREEVVADYALTGERIEKIYDRLVGAASYADDLRDRAIDDMRPQALSMRHFLDRLDERGGVVAWLTEHGFGPDEQAALRERLVG
ncbi:MAG: tyrosine-protein phosphatase [Actinobacteria bacterium]|nr:tyrosine-protein phosphatase [Actinomycetota bacterium]MCA1719928.1 tyrosine-protein phosphatase [Actinomycetota bacterium]